jgi:hypothetical protein
LSCNSYAYVEAFWTMEMENWIQAHVNAYEFYGGVTRILIPDNLKTGVTSNTHTEIALVSLFTLKYASIVVLNEIGYAQALPLFGLRASCLRALSRA